MIDLQGRIWKIGSQGPVVMQMQLKLKDLGFPLKGTGYFGNATHSSLKEFQKKVGARVDGVFGPEAARFLDSAKAQNLPTVIKQEIGRPIWLQVGLSTLGTRETPGAGDNPAILDWADEIGGNIEKQYTHDFIPWCALWANYILSEASLPGTGTLWALDFAGKWPAVNIGEPAVGAFAPMVRNGGGHIMCVVGRDHRGNIMGIGGNQGDAVTIAVFARSRLNKGFWWPESVPHPKNKGFALLPVVASNGKVSSNEQ